MSFLRRRVSASRTGSARGGDGSVNVTGNLIGDVYQYAGMPVRSRYHHQVARIAPPELRDRDGELAELAQFCTDPEQAGQYQWWRAPMWSGKTALMSWFVLHPPPGVRIVSFFITARLAAQNDRSAFAPNVIEQLLAILGQPMPRLTDATQDAHLLGLLDETARHCQQRHESLVLLVDGLDEDRGVSTGLAAHSIAAVLPATLPAGMRVIVAGRPNPLVPDDVPEHHPLRDPRFVRRLTVSAHAQAREREMNEALHELLDGPPENRALVGLLVAAGGGLTAADLAELSGWPTRTLTSRLDTVAARALDRRLARWTGPDAYLLGHEELHRAALAEIGPDELGRYRQRLHEWAARYRERAWPTGSPEYLLSGYVSGLLAAGDLDRALQCVTDQARQERLFDVSGSDSAVLTEIMTTLKQLAEQDEPDLLKIGCLAVHRDYLSGRNVSIPPDLPAMWAAIGHGRHAEDLARSMPGSGRVKVLLGITHELAVARHMQRARRLAAEIEMITNGHPGKAEVLAGLSVSAALTGDGQWSQRLAAQSEHLLSPFAVAPVGQALTELAEAARLIGDVVEARRLADRAEQVIFRIRPANRPPLLANLARTVESIGDEEAARRLATAAEADLPSIRNPFYRLRAYAGLVRAVTVIGDAEWRQRLAASAEEIVSHQAEVAARTQFVAYLARQVAAAGDQQYSRRLAAEAVSLVRSATPTAASLSTVMETPWTQALTDVAWALAVTGDVEQAVLLATETEDLARVSATWYYRTKNLIGLAGAITERSDQEWATRLLADIVSVARDITGAEPRIRVLGVLARAATVISDREWARQLAAEAETLATRAATQLGSESLFAGAAQAASAAGDSTQTVRLALRAESQLTFGETGYLSQLLADMAVAVAAIGNFAEAWRLAAAAGDMGSTSGSYRDRHGDAGIERRVQILATLAETAAAVGDRNQAAGFAARAGEFARTLSPSYPRAHVALAVLTAIAAAGDREWVERSAAATEDLVRSLADPDTQAAALARLVKAVMTGADGTPVASAAGRLAWSRRLLADCLALGHWSVAMPVLAQVCPPAAVAIVDEVRIIHRRHLDSSL